MTRAFVLVAGLVVVACGGNSGGPGPCEADPNLPECLQACDPLPGAPNTCPTGFHCAPDGTCDAQCTQGGSECGSGRSCTIDGECVDDGNDANLGPDADCPDVTFTAEQVIPTVQLLLDRSGSMSTSYGGTTRYDAMHDALVGNDGLGGVVGDYQASVYFGATLYTGSDAVCTDLVSNATGRQLNNLTSIQQVIDANGPSNDTPTGESLRDTYMEMIANPPPAGSPPIIVLATDGEPDTCADGDDEVTGRMYSIQHAQAAFAAGIRVFVLSVGTDVGNAHLQKVANAGAGQDPDTGTAPYYVATSPAALAAAFDAIIGGVASCDLVLDGDITVSQAEAGTVLLNGSPLMYGTDWTLVGMNTIHLEPGACEILQSTSNPTVTGTFPCGSIIE